MFNYTFKKSEVYGATAKCIFINGNERAEVVKSSNGKYYLVQNLWDGLDIPESERKGYKFSWELKEEGDSFVAEYIPPKNSDGTRHEITICTLEELKRKQKEAARLEKLNPFWSKEFDFGTSFYEGRVRDYHTSRRGGYPTFVGKHKAKYCVGIELETISTKPTSEVLKKSNWISFEKDGSLSSGGVEFVTAPIPADRAMDPKFWEKLCEYLNDMKFKSYRESSCGLHAHIGTGALGETDEEKKNSLARVLYFYQCILTDNLKNKVFKRSTQSYCNALSLSSARTLNQVKDYLKKGAEKVVWEEKSQDSGRYSEINHNTNNGFKTIEFRRGKGSINPNRIACIIALCCTLCEYCRKVTEISKLSMDGYSSYVYKKLPKNHPLVEVLKDINEE
jgi:hypothetical protein